MALTLDQLCKKKPHITPVEIEGIGTANVRSISGDVRSQVESLWANARDDEGELDATKLDTVLYRRLIVSGSLCDDDGELLCETAGDTDRVMSLPWQTVEAIFNAGMKASALTDDNIEDAEKN